MSVMRSIDVYFEACRAFDRKFDRKFDRAFNIEFDIEFDIEFYFKQNISSKT
jgi:hypothetical protein